MNTLQRRHQQKQSWNESDTAKMPATFRIPSRVNFQKNVQFLAACSNLDWEEITGLLNSGVDINVGSVDGLTALHQACIDSNLDLVEFLVKHSAILDIPDREGWTPLHAAVSCGFLEIVKYLVERGARLDALSFDNELPLDVVNPEDKEIHDYLLSAMLSRGIDPVLARDVERRLMLKDAQEWFTTGNYNPEIDRQSLATPLHIAASKNYVDVLEVLLCIPQVNVNALDADGWTPLHSAAHWGQRQACEMLLKHPGVDLEILTFTNQSVLEVADKELREFLYDARRKYHETKRAYPKVQPEQAKHEYGKKKKLSVTRLSTVEKQQMVEKESAAEGSTLRECGVVPPDPVTDFTLLPMDATVSNENLDADVTATLDLDALTEVQESGNVDVELTFSAQVHGDETPTVIAPPVDHSVLILPEVPAPAPDTSVPGKVETTKTAVEEPPASTPPATTSNPNRDAQGRRLSAVLSPEKAAEKEAQRTTRARQARASRRSTQGVTLEDIQAAKEFGDSNNVTDKTDGHSTNPADTATSPSAGDDVESVNAWRIKRQNRRAATAAAAAAGKQENGAENSATDTQKLAPSRDSSSPSSPALAYKDSIRLSRLSDKHVPPTSESSAAARNGRVRPTSPTPSSTIPTPQTSRATWLNNNNVLKDNNATNNATDTTDYEQLYRLELQQKEQLLMKLKELQQDKEASEQDLARLRKPTSAVSRAPPAPGRDAELSAKKLTEYEERMKEIERLKLENAKMKEENIALVGVIRRLSRSRLA